MVPISILDQNDRAHFYTHVQVEKPYIASTPEMYISLWQQELRTCKRIGDEFYCELFVVKHKTKYSCESAIYFDLGTDIIKDNCNFRFYYKQVECLVALCRTYVEVLLGGQSSSYVQTTFLVFLCCEATGG